jgi:LAGLIDADG DNA endonuclease family protein
VGQVLANKRYDNHREHLHRYVVRRRADLIDRIIPFFRAYPMHSSKQANFEKFAQCVEMINAGHHLSREGLADVVEIAETMNRQKPRTDLLRILRGHTPNIQDTG